jgi:dTDP-4-amino-4,6-dideoxygalactose transaminase
MNIPLFKVRMSSETKEKVPEVLMSGMITQGKKVDEFENSLKEWFRYPYLLTLNSATSGLTIAYHVLKSIIENENGNNNKPIKPIKVITSSLTCMANTCSIISNNLSIVWGDVDKRTCNIDLEDVKNKLTEETRILSLVSWGGTSVNLDEVEELKIYYKNKFNKNLYVIQDESHAFGSEYNGKKLGTTYNNIAVYSFQAIKMCTTCDGGLIILPNMELYERVKLLRWFGISREIKSSSYDSRLENDIKESGFKAHMHDVSAVIGLCNLKNIEIDIKKNKENGKYYNENLKNIKDIELLKVDPKCDSIYWIYTIKILNNRKEEFNKYMLSCGIMTSQVHKRNDTHSCVSQFKTHLPNLDQLENEITCIPSGWWITNDDREYIVECIKKFGDLFVDKTEEMKIRVLNDYDLDNYIDLMYHMNQYKQDIINPNFSLTNNNNIYGLFVNDKLVSTCKLLIENKLYNNLGHIEDVVTSIDNRKKGYIKKLLTEVIKIAKTEYKCYKIVLNCKEELKNVYESCGMIKTGLSFSI